MAEQTSATKLSPAAAKFRTLSTLATEAAAALRHELAALYRADEDDIPPGDVETVENALRAVQGLAKTAESHAGKLAQLHLPNPAGSK